MSRRELGIVATVVSSLVVYGLYLVIVFGMCQEGRFDTADATSLVGKAILLLMLAQIVAYIVATAIVFNPRKATISASPKSVFCAVHQAVPRRRGILTTRDVVLPESLRGRWDDGC